MEFLQRNRVLLTSGALMFFSLLLISASARSPGRDPLARFLLDGLFPFQASVSWVWDGARRTWNSYLDLVDVEEENRALHERILRLEQEVVLTGELEASNQRLEELLQFREQLDGSAFGARVIGRDPIPTARTFTIDRGKRDGVLKGMAVVAPQGVVGHVTDVGWAASRVLLLTDHNSGIDAVIQRSRARGIIEGALDEGCHMKYLRRGEDVQVGDRVITSGLDGIFPRGLPIGTVSEVSRRHRGLLQVAIVQPSAPLDRMEEVLVVEATAGLLGLNSATMTALEPPSETAADPHRTNLTESR